MRGVGLVDAARRDDHARRTVDAGAFTPPGASGKRSQGLIALPAFCRVAATLKPSSDSDIKIEVWMPASDWNGKFQAVGNGAFNGTIAYAAMMTALAPRLCDQLHRHRACRRRRELGARTPGESDRFRLARGPRDDGDVEEDHRQPTTTRGPTILVLERLLRRRTAGDEGSAALPGGFRRHHRRRAGPRLDRARGPGGARREGAGEDRSRAPVSRRSVNSCTRRSSRRAMPWTA